MFVGRYISLSISHLTPETRKRLDIDPPGLAFPHPEIGEGGFVFVSTDPGSDADYYPEDLVEAFKYARRHGCDYILFETGAMPIEELPQYEMLEFDNAWAEKEGWAVFDTADGLRIQKDDDSDAFKDDEEALEFVKTMAQCGSAYHQAALDEVGQATLGKVA